MSIKIFLFESVFSEVFPGNLSRVNFLAQVFFLSVHQIKQALFRYLEFCRLLTIVVLKTL